MLKSRQWRRRSKPHAAALRPRLRRALFYKLERVAWRPFIWRRQGHAMRDRDAGGATLRRDHESKGPQYQGKCDAQFRLRASGRLSQGAAADAARREI